MVSPEMDVLSVFMTGLGLGSWLGGMLIRRFERSSAAIPLRLYGALELVIGCSGFIAPALIVLGYRLLRDAGKSLAWGSSFYYLVSGIWIRAGRSSEPIMLSAIRIPTRSRSLTTVSCP